MATVVNNPPVRESGSGYGFLLGILLFFVLALLLFLYVVPYFTQSLQNTQPQVNVPGKIDVNVQQPK